MRINVSLARENERWRDRVMFILIDSLSLFLPRSLLRQRERAFVVTSSFPFVLFTWREACAKGIKTERIELPETLSSVLSRNNCIQLWVFLVWHSSSPQLRKWILNEQDDFFFCFLLLNPLMSLKRTGRKEQTTQLSREITVTEEWPEKKNNNQDRLTFVTCASSLP